jgi:small subunit ribosomal protein S9
MPAKKIVEEVEIKEDAPKVKKVSTKKVATKKVDAEVETKEKEEVKVKKAPAKKAKVAKDKTIQFLGTGKRKKSIARVRLLQGNGKFIINDIEIAKYFPFGTLSQVATQPLTLLNATDKFDVYVNVVGGGFNGQAGAIRLGVARALVKFDETYKQELRKAGYLTRDARIKERKKYGLRKARRAVQFSK